MNFTVLQCIKIPLSLGIILVKLQNKLFKVLNLDTIRRTHIIRVYSILFRTTQKAGKKDDGSGPHDKIS